MRGRAAIAVLMTAGLAAIAPAAAGARQRVTVTRDRAGIPHIVASSFGALGYGEGYAFAQDNLCTFADDVVTLEGQRSRWFGPDATAVNYSAGAYETNLQSDEYWQYVRASGLVNRWLRARPPVGPVPQVREVYEGFAHGYNAYLRSGRLRDPRCRGKGWVRPITMDDLMLRGEQIATEATAQQFIGGIVGAQPPGAKAARAARSDARSLGALNAQLGGASAIEGSNGIGLGSLDTQSGDGMVLANPHFPWRGTERFWMAQLDVPGRYDVEGGTLEGFPLIGIGFNRHMAWTHTVSTSRRFIVYQLKLVPGDPTSYYVDGRPTKMGHVTIHVRYPGKTIAHTFYTTRWGLVFNLPAAGYNWSATTAYALWDSTADDGPRAANQYLQMGEAPNVHALYAVEARYLAIPTFNTIAADDFGRAFYGDVGNTPNVTQAEINRCMPSGVAQIVFAAARVVTLDGSRADCAPANDPGTPVHGIFNASHEPHLFRRDYVENSNDSFWLANPSDPLTGFSPVIGLTGTEQGLRTRLGNEMIAQRMNGTDGLGKPKFTISTLQRMWESDRSLQAELTLKPLVAACRAQPSAVASNGQTVDLTAACAALAAYDGTGRLNARGGWLFSEWNAHLPASGVPWATAFDPHAPLTTPSGLNTSDPAVLRALADAVQELQAHNIPLDASYGQVQYTQRHTRIPIPGCDTGCFNAIYSANGLSDSPIVANPYGEVYTGSSLVMTTRLTRRGPVSQGILTYSQATDPTSPWYANMTHLYSRSRWVKLPYTARELRRSHPLRPLVLTP